MAEQTSDDAENIARLGEEHGEFHVVGVGASAGGLEALEVFFHGLPDDPGMAFVVIQHLSPDFKSHMEELLGRHTRMPIHRVENGMQVERNAVYLIPAKMEMVISEGKLLLTERSGERSFSHPIDQFFRSLASDSGRYSIGVILSGTGSDGSRGIRDIHDAGGLVLVQDEKTAKFDGMPMNAQATGVVDLVLPPQVMPEVLLRYTKERLTPSRLSEQELMTINTEGIDRIFHLLHTQHGLDFSHYKSSTVGRRIQRRVDLMNVSSIEDYVRLLESDATELNDLYKDLLIGVTKFFRDPEAYEVLERDVVPKLFSRAEPGHAIRVWVAGCASGEEAYSIAMLLDEERRKRKAAVEIKVFATDVHHVSLHAAARGVFPEEALSELTQERRTRYFRKRRDGFHVTRELRQHIVFAPHNVISDAPFTQMDLVSCRNLLIYLQPAAQKKALALFHFALKSGSTLFLGPSESPGELSDEFAVLDKRWRIYTKRRDVRLPLETRIPLGTIRELPRASTAAASRVPRVDDSLVATYDRLLDRKMPPSILVNENHEVLHVFGGAEKYLRPRGGRPTNNILDMIDPALKTAVLGSLQHALRKQDAVRYTGIRINSGENKGENIELSVEPVVLNADNNQSFLIEITSELLTDIQPGSTDEAVSLDIGKVSEERVAALESELRYSQENLQATIEEMETANEELQASNEELVASNEELQSTNEELHSVNEELYTVNAEHQRRVEELAEANADMDNLLATTRVGVIFLDDELCIRRFTPEIARQFQLMSQDIGRSIEGFTHHLKHNDLVEDLRDVLRHQREKELELEDRHGNPYLLRMLPYRSGDHVQGVVLTLIDIRTLKATQRRIAAILDTAAEGIYGIDKNGVCTFINRSALEMLGYENEAEVLGRNMHDLIHHTHRDGSPHKNEDCQIYKAFRQELSSHVSDEVFWAKDGKPLPVEYWSRPFVRDGEVEGSVVSFQDISERLSMTNQMEQMGMMLDASHDAIIVWELGGKIISWNVGATRLYGYTADEARGAVSHELLSTVHPEAWDDIHRALSEHGEWIGELEHRTKDGRTVHVSSRHQLLVMPDGQRHVLELNRDITEQKRIEEQLLEANAAALKASEAKSAFLANISHELRTPMTAVLGFADILRMESETPESVEHVDTIKRNGEYLLALLNDLLDLSKIEAGKLKIQNEPISIQKVIDDIRNLMSVRAKEEGIPLRFEYASEMPVAITADEVRIRQILVNLISNAIKFTDHGEVIVKAHVVQVDGRSRMDISVTDTGIGMTAEQQRELFTPFSQPSQDSTKRFGGTGLGLSISKRLAEGMGGSISVQSTLDEGSCFTLSLPLTDQQADNQSEVSEHSNADDAVSPGSHLPRIDARILLADDRRDVWRVGKYFLEKCGADVTIVEDGQQAVDEIQRAAREQRPFSLILMDMQMPVMNGREAVKQIRKLGFELPIIALTADAMDGEREACLKIGCDDYFPKPIHGAKLMNLIAEHLEKFQGQAQPGDLQVK